MIAFFLDQALYLNYFRKLRGRIFFLKKLFLNLFGSSMPSAQNSSLLSKWHILGRLVLDPSVCMSGQSLWRFWLFSGYFRGHLELGKSPCRKTEVERGIFFLVEKFSLG